MVRLLQCITQTIIALLLRNLLVDLVVDVCPSTGVRMLDGPVTDVLEAEAVTFNNQYVDIYSASWGPTDDGRTMEGPHHYCQQALQQGISKV